METFHRPIFSDATAMDAVEDGSINLVLTSPPYPMVQMWDTVFSLQDPAIGRALENQQGPLAFEAMHRILDQVWTECFRVLAPGGFACINIGDATRSLGSEFALYPNHSRILSKALSLGFTCLPTIIWRKQTNAPNKFMGSGMLPAGAYVTLEHEYILILRKGGKRVFTSEAQRQRRRESAIFWEERNQWFSDVWMDIKGSRQALGNKETRGRSAAYPFELAHRLTLMYSVKQDRILDPFLGLGTTMAAAMATGRNSLGYEIDPNLGPVIAQTSEAAVAMGKEAAQSRLKKHERFIQERCRLKGPTKHWNAPHDMAVVTAQEKELHLSPPKDIEMDPTHLVPEYFKITY